MICCLQETLLTDEQLESLKIGLLPLFTRSAELAAQTMPTDGSTQEVQNGGLPNEPQHVCR